MPDLRENINQWDANCSWLGCGGEWSGPCAERSRRGWDFAETIDSISVFTPGGPEWSLALMRVENKWFVAEAASIWRSALYAW
jgi:hypothetical protein